MYGSTSKSVNTSYVSSYPGAVTRTGSASKVKEAMSRSGQNGIYLYRKTAYLHLRVPRKIRYVARVDRFFVLRKRVIGYRTIAGRPIYKTKRTYRGNFVTISKVVVGYRPERKKKIYAWVQIPKSRKIWAEKVVFIKKKVVIPGIRLQDLSPHPMSFSSEEYTGFDTSCVLEHYNVNEPNKKGVTNIVGSLSGIHSGGQRPFGYTSDLVFQNYFGNSSVEGPLLSEALFKLYSGARNGIANFTNILAEAQGVRRTVLQYAVGVVGNLLKGKRAVLSAIGGTISDRKKIASAYLSYVYGLSPMIDDMNATINEINKQADTWRRYAGKAKREWETETRGYGVTSRWTLKRKFSFIVKYQATIVGSTAMQFIPNHHAPNIPQAAWELIPWSFALDWLIPIGKWLEGADLFSGVTVKYGHFSVLYREEYELTIQHGGEVGDWRYGAGVQTFTGKLVKFRRQITPIPAMPFPRAKNPFSIRHALNGLFLLMSKLR